MTTVTPPTDEPSAAPAPAALHAPSTKTAVRGIALFEAAKGLLVLLVGFDLLRPVHRAIGFNADELVRHFHMNPASRFPHIFVEATSKFEGKSMTPLALGALVYALIRFTEAYGLWRQRAWAEWFAAASGAIYIPFEIRHLIVHQNHRVLTTLVLLANILIVYVMVRALRRRSAVAPIAG